MQGLEPTPSPEQQYGVIRPLTLAEHLVAFGRQPYRTEPTIGPLGPAQRIQMLAQHYEPVRPPNVVAFKPKGLQK